MIKKKSKISILIISILISLTLVQGITISNTTFLSSNCNSEIYPNATINLTKLVIGENNIEIYNLTGGGNFTNIGSKRGFIYFYNLIVPYNNIRWNNLTTETILTTNIMIPLTISELIEVYYGIGEGAQTIIKTGGTTVINANYTPYIIAIGSLIVLIFIFLIAFAEINDRKKKRFK